MQPAVRPPQANQISCSESANANDSLLIVLYLVQIAVLLPTLTLHFMGCACKACFIGLQSKLAQWQHSYESRQTGFALHR